MTSHCDGGYLLVIFTLLPLPLIHAEAPQPVAKKTDGHDRRAAGPTRTSRLPITESIVAVQHQGEQDGWQTAETANFRLLHQHARSLAEAVLRTAEDTRAIQMRKWFGQVGANWQPKCPIYLYPSGEAYSAATGAPIYSGGGHTDIQAEDGRVVRRSIHMHGSRTFLLNGVVPHEVTHAVLAGRLSGGHVPRWADEGMAILAETQAHIERHIRYLPRWHADNALFSMRTLLEMRDYPGPHTLGIFYAQSVSLVDFLTRQKGAECFIAFVRDGERDGYTASLRKHYGWSFAELDRYWRRHTFYDKRRMVETAREDR
jgi:hypothetical protein